MDEVASPTQKKKNHHPGATSEAAKLKFKAAKKRQNLFRKVERKIDIETMVKRMKHGKRFGLPKSTIDKDKPKYYLKPIEQDDILTRAIKKSTELFDALMGLNQDEMFLYLFIAEFTVRHHVPPTLAEMVAYIQKFDELYAFPFTTPRQGKFTRMSEANQVKKLVRVMYGLMEKGWVIWDPLIPGTMILIGRNAYIRELEAVYPPGTRTL